MGKEQTQFGDKITQLLQKHDMSQRELASIIGTTEMTVSRYVRNQRQPKAEVIVKIADVFNVTTDELLGREKQQSQLFTEEQKEWIRQEIAKGKE